MWAWRWLQRGTTGRQTLTLRYYLCTSWSVSQMCVLVQTPFVKPPLALCCRMTYQSRSRGGEQRPSRARDGKSTSGKRCRTLHLEMNNSHNVEKCRSECGCCVATGRGSESWTQAVRHKVSPNMGSIWWHLDSENKLLRFCTVVMVRP